MAGASPLKTSVGNHAASPSLGLHADARPFVPGTQSPPETPGCSPAEVMDSPVDQSPIPYGMDRDAFVAGERAAMARTLQMLLPSQQAIGMLTSGLQRLEARVQEEAGHARHSHLATADCRSVIQGLSQRLDYLEKIRLAAMDNRIQHAIEAPLSQEFQATLLGLQETLGTISEKTAYQPYSLTGFAVRQISWLGSTAALYTQKAISNADVAAIFLSRKILVDSRGGLLEDGTADGKLPSSAMSQSARATVGALLFLAAVEAAWQTHSSGASVQAQQGAGKIVSDVMTQRMLQFVKYFPERIQRAVTPAQLGLRILRGATWAATMTLSAVYFRRGCYVAADSAFGAFDRVLKQLPSLRPFSRASAKLVNGSRNVSKPYLQIEDWDGSKPDSSLLEDSEAAGSESSGFQNEAATLSSQKPRTAKQRSIFDTPPPSPPV